MPKEYYVYISEADFKRLPAASRVDRHGPLPVRWAASHAVDGEYEGLCRDVAGLERVTARLDELGIAYRTVED